MSATGRGTTRVEKDFYPTPAWCVEAMAAKVDWEQVHTACEPCRGSGAIVEAVKPWFSGPWRCYEIREGWDYHQADLYPCDITITNPPYDQALEFVQKSLRHSRCVAYLLRINFLGSAKRKGFFENNRPTHLYVLSERPSFVDVCAGHEKPEKKKGCGAVFQKVDAVKKCPDCLGKVKAGTDATEYAWICWDMGKVLRDLPGIYVL